MENIADLSLLHGSLLFIGHYRIGINAVDKRKERVEKFLPLIGIHIGTELAQQPIHGFQRISVTTRFTAMFVQPPTLFTARRIFPEN